LGELRKQIIWVGMLFTLVIALGTAGYIVIEGWNFLEAIYMTVITLTTVGYKEVHELSFYGKIFTIFLLVGGMGTVLYSLTVGARVILEGELRKVFWRRKLKKMIQGLKDHYIVCGYGRMGKIISRELKEEGVEFVAIEKNPNHEGEDGSTLLITGDATRDATLKEAGIESAKGLVSVLPSDAENLYVVLSARGLNPNLLIVVRAMEEGAEEKLLRAGANKVVSPYHIGGLRMAHTILKPTVMDFIEFATRSGNIELQLQEIEVQKNSELSGITLEACGIGRDLGVIIVAIKKPTGVTWFNPTFRSTIGEKDKLIALGEVSKLRVIEEMAKERPKA
jgi:voltage-gated potassium channel